MQRGVLAALVVACLGAGVTAQDTAPNRRAFTVVARDGAFAPDRLEVVKDDLVTITLTSGDGPYSFAIDEYRLMKRTGAGQSITFQFRAARTGKFLFYCNLSSEERCRDMKGTLVVQER